VTLSREIPLEPRQAALLFIDVQNLTANREADAFMSLSRSDFEEKYGWFFQQLESHVLTNVQTLQLSFRDAGAEVIYTTIESLTLDGRDRSLTTKSPALKSPRAHGMAR